MRRVYALAAPLLLIAACTASTSVSTTAVAFLSTAPTFPRDDTAPSTAITTAQPTTTLPWLGPGSTRGALPDGTTFDVYLDPARTESVTGIGAGLVIELADGTELVAGILTFSSAATDVYAWEGLSYRIPTSDTGSAVLDVYDDVAEAVGPEFRGVFEAGIVGSQVAGYPVLKLTSPFRWANDDEIPLQMEVQFETFVVRRGCGELAVSCSSTHRVQVIPADSVFAPAPPWASGQQAWIEAAGDRPLGDAWFLDPGPLGPRASHDVIWTGEVMIVWGGTAGDRLPHLVEGAAFDPQTGEWRIIPPPPIEPEQATRAHWLGDEMIVMSSESIIAYDPTSDTWRVVGPGFRPAVHPGMTVSAADLVYTWAPDAIIELDPESGRWRELPRPGFGRYYDQWSRGLLSIGAEIYAVGLVDGSCSGRQISNWTGERWTPLPTVSLASEESADCSLPNQSATIGGRLIVWGDNSSPAFAYDPETQDWSTIGSTTLSGTEGPLGPVDLGDRLLVPQYGEASIYDPQSESWTAVTLPGGGEDTDMVWTGEEVLMWGASCCYGSSRFNSQDAWRWTPPGN